MRKDITTFVLVCAAIAFGGCSRSSESNLATENNNQSVMAHKRLAGIAEVAIKSGDLIPANVEMIRLMKLPILGQDGNYYCRQLILKPHADDLRAIYVGVNDPNTIILGRFNQRPDAFERYAYLTSPSGDLRCIVDERSGSHEQYIIANGDPGYDMALKDFEAQVMFWSGMERELRANLKHK